MSDVPFSPDENPNIEQNVNGEGNLTTGNIIQSTVTINNFNESNGEPVTKTNTQPKSSLKESPLDLLPLVNRQQQEEKLTEVIPSYLNQDDSQPLVCIIHGDELQDHDLFLQRIKIYSLRKCIKLDKSQEIQNHALALSPKLQNMDYVESKLFQDLHEEIFGEELSEYNSDTREKINQHLCRDSIPLILYADLLTKDWQDKGNDILDKLLDFSQRLPGLFPEKKLIVFLLIQYQLRHSTKRKELSIERIKRLFLSWLAYFLRKPHQDINQRIKKQIKIFSESNFKRFEPLSGIVLDELEGITETDVREWASRDVKKKSDEKVSLRLLREVNEIFRKWEKEHPSEVNSDTIPMRVLAAELTTLIKDIINQL